MIVKNEGARMERCLRSVLPYVKAVAILDTGSTDDTIEIIHRLCEEYEVAFGVSRGEFVNFSQARNDAWKFARANNHPGRWCQFAILMDADMELVVESENCFDLPATACSYNMMQTGGALTYANRRIVNLDTPKDEIYVGVTHEYIDLPSDGDITGARFIDHADGANRTDKFLRDCQLLEEALKGEPNNERYWFYLGNSYRDWADCSPEEERFPLITKAIEAFNKRVALGGWDEEVHQAMMARARCWLALNTPHNFVGFMMEAYNFRPSRAEPLFELAKYYREKGDHAASLLFSKPGMKIARPNDILFVNDVVHRDALRFEYSVSGYYDEKERPFAFQITDDLALDAQANGHYRWGARTNLFWFTQPLKHYCSSFKTRPVNFLPPRGYTAMNPSVEACHDKILCNVRCVNYTIDEHGRYMIGDKGCQEAPIETRNFVLSLDGDLDTLHAREIIWHRPAPKFDLVVGLEDIRLYRWCGNLWFTACVREQASNGTCQQLRGKLVHDIDDRYYLVEQWEFLSGEDSIEKNWMPKPHGTHQDFMYRLDRVRHADPGGQWGETKHPTKLHVGDISGSSQLIPFRHGWIAITHEAATGPDGKRTYWHRFAWFNIDGELRRLSLPFVFEDRQIEFCAGLARHPNGSDFIISYGVRDAEAKLATVNEEEVAQMIWKFHEN
jgi:glycosyltransferase involved in cell wall biosynthesis